MARKWIRRAVGRRRGALHRQLGVPLGVRIPVVKLRRAARGAYGPLARRRAQLALNLRKLARR